jgi:GR25 family glycosyltransferase involved in LPS biosynthesis
MKIGIPFSSSADLRLSGANQTAVLLGEIMLALGHAVTFIDCAAHSWWTDVPRIEGTVVTSLYDAEGLDVLLDVDGKVAPEQRKMANQTIVFLRSFVQFMEMDAAVYPEVPYVPRSMKGVSEIWCWDLLNPVETIPSIQTLFPCPIRRVPFVWSSSITDWMSGRAMAPIGSTDPSQWIIHVAEKNNHNTSSVVLPLVAIRELTLKNALPAKYVCHHVDAILQNRFLKENVLDNLQAHSLPVIFAPTEPFANWLQEPHHALFSHTRFLPLRTSLIQAVWMGLPLIHNSPVLRDLHPVLAKTYYKGNHIQGIMDAFQWLHTNTGEWYAAQEDLRRAIGRTWGLLVHVDAWRSLTQTAFSLVAPAAPAVPVAPAAAPVAPVAMEKHVAFAEPLTETRVIPARSAPSALSETVIGFSDMWPGFNTNSNFIMDALRQESSHLFRGVPWSAGMEVHLLIAGPFGTSWKGCTAPLVFFTAESHPAPEDERFRLFLTSSVKEDDTHMRIPTWMTFIDWYSGATVLPLDSQDNPIRLPLHFATHAHPVPFEARSAFCAFVVSNPTCAMRNEAFQALHAYRPVTSGGALFNNIGGPLALKYPGGGSGDLSKHHFFSQHQFSLSFENAQQEGYITEKVLHAKMAGCVPLYWGANTDSDFAPNAILNLSRLGSASQIVDVVRQLEANPAVCAAIAATPLLNEEKKEKALAILKAMSQRLLALLFPAPAAPSVSPVAVSPAAVPPAVPSAFPLKRINKTFVINLDTRRDRWDSLVAAEPLLAPFLTRLPAVHGKTMTLNPFLYRLFEHNRYQWKKSVMACFLSHMSAWSAILQEKEEGYYLILEDDVRFRPGWQESWAACAASIPADADLLYLGGVLPPNLPALPLASESVNDHWCRIKPNTLFSPVLAPVFHFCAYSYALTKRGAQRLLTYLTQSDARCSVECDHLIGHSAVGLVKYITRPLLTYCYQESDPTYVNAAFNEIIQAHSFDSDIQNNSECFTETDLAPFRVPAVVPAAVASEVPAAVASEVPAVASEVPAAVASEVPAVEKSSLTVYYDSNLHPGTFQIYEQKWLEDMMSTPLTILPCHEEMIDTVPSASWFIVQRPHSARWNTRFQQMNQKGRDFYVLHLSDEFANDCIDFYSLPHCKGVIRNYTRADIPPLPHLLTIPLGYHYPYTETVAPFSNRELLWSFHGTNWCDRKTQLERLANCVPYNCLLLPSWNHSAMTNEKDYMNLMGKTKFCPVLRGNNMETFRLYEALEAGCVPVCMETDPFLDRVDRELDLTSLYAWKDPVATISSPFQAGIQQEVLRRWTAWKERVRVAVRALL